MNTSNTDSEKPQIHVDSDWKAQAQAEKQRLAQKAGDAASSPSSAAGGTRQAAAGSRKRGETPPANFQTLVSTMITQAMFALGMIPDPQTGQRVAVLDLARHHIDMLSVLEEKTKGNLSDEETKLLATALYELRMQYVNLSQQAIREQMGAPGSEG